MEKDLVARLEAAVSRLETISAGGSQPSITSRDLHSFGDLHSDPSILAFDDLIEESLGKVSSPAYKIGGKVLEATKIIKEAFAAEKELLIRARMSQKPDRAGLGEFVKPLNEVIMKANALTEGKPSDAFNHLKAATDSLSALAWIAYSGKDCGMGMPIAHVEESWQMAEFYNNKILVEYKNKDPEHIEWAKALKELYVPGLRDYVKAFYPLGPVWSTTGSVIASSSTSASSAPKAPPGRGPPPPPSPSSSLFSSGTTSSRPTQGMSAVFQEISSKPVTAGLRKVTDDMKAKNRTDRSGIVTVTARESSTSSISKSGPPKFELQMGRKWAVENQIGNKDLVINDCDSKQSVYVFGCKDSVLQVRGKVNNITIDKCSKMGILFMDVVAAFEIVNCNVVEVQSQGSAPTISIDNTAGCQLYLSEESLQTSITTAKSTEINVLVPSAGADDGWAEHALPQQFVHTFKGDHFETLPLSHSGA